MFVDAYRSKESDWSVSRRCFAASASKCCAARSAARAPTCRGRLGRRRRTSQTKWLSDEAVFLLVFDANTSDLSQCDLRPRRQVITQRVIVSDFPSQEAAHLKQLQKEERLNGDPV